MQLPSGSDYTIRATPAATGSPTVWVLGSSENSARLAASLGMPYVFANHFAGDGLKSAMESYRTTYQPSAAHPEPRTFLTVNVVAAPTAEEAEERVQPQLRVFARMLTGRPPQALETVEQALAAPADAAMDQATQTLGSRWMVGTGETVATELREFAERNAVEEVMIVPMAGSYDSEQRDSTPGRAQTLELVTAAL